MTEAQIFDHLRVILTETFEIDAARIAPESNLFTDLDLDSIDAVDLAIKLQELTGQRIKPQDFRSIRTVGDAVAAIRQLLSA